MSIETNPNQNKLFIHLGFGAPEFRSYELIKCSKVTSYCAKRRSGITYVAKYVDRVMIRLEPHIKELQNPIYVYKYSNRVYKVYPYSDELWDLLKAIMEFSYILREYCKSSDDIKEVNCYNKVLMNIGMRCESGVQECLKAIDEWSFYIDRIKWSKRVAGTKALLTRLKRSHERCLPILRQYFSDVLNYLSFRDRVNDPAVYVNDSAEYSVCFNGVFNHLKKFYDEDRARRYADRMCRGFNTVFLLARDGIMVLDLRSTPTPVEIYAMDCVDKPSYTIVKLVAVREESENRVRVDWVAILGLDKPTNQVFIHYVPRTLLFRDVETCRRWVMGLADNWGYPTRYDYELVEA